MSRLVTLFKADKTQKAEINNTLINTLGTSAENITDTTSLSQVQKVAYELLQNFQWDTAPEIEPIAQDIADILKDCGKVILLEQYNLEDGQVDFEEGYVCATLYRFEGGNYERKQIELLLPDWA